MSVKQRNRRLHKLLDQVGPTRSLPERFPHELSGGQAQRLVLAGALALQPQVPILDEPVSALDVSIQAQILTLLCEFRRRLNLTYLFISHDLAVVVQLCDELLVMRQGRMVERGRRERIYGAPQQSYARALIAAVPVLGSRLSAR